MHNRLEEVNYRNDARVRAKDEWDGFDQQTMKKTVVITDRETEDEEEVDFPCEFEVCDLCHGKGTVVDPNIDCCGLTREDFAEDPGFAEDYHAGYYDIPCPACRGNRVVPSIVETRMDADTKRLYERWLGELDDEAAYEAECAAERRMGA